MFYTKLIKMHGHMNIKYNRESLFVYWMYHNEKEAQIPRRNIARFPAQNAGFSIPNNFASVATESAVLPLSLKLVTTLMFA